MHAEYLAEKVNTYDQVPYEGSAFPQTHPYHLAVIAHLMGMDAPAVHRCRVLELGCCNGGNLLPMAEQLPDAQFVGIDSSSRQVDEGVRFIAEISLKNVRLHQRDILDVDADLGEFDYIIAHGVYSWVSDQVKDKILSICSENLAPGGVAYISYNTFPGWRMKGLLRDVMCYGGLGGQHPLERMNGARRFVQWLGSALGEDQSVYAKQLRHELGRVATHRDSYLLHEYLDDHNDPLYFHEFIERAQRHGLGYLAESEFGSMSLQALTPSVRMLVQQASANVIEREQILDLLGNRTFRQTLLCHEDNHSSREVQPQRMFDLFVASPAKPQNPISNLRLLSREAAVFRAHGGQTRTAEPVLKAVLMGLGEVWPQSVNVAALIEFACNMIQGLGGNVTPAHPQMVVALLLRCFETGQVELSTVPSNAAAAISDRPVVRPIARHQAHYRSHLTNLMHKEIFFSEFERLAMRHLDGTRDLLRVKTELAEMARQGMMPLGAGDLADGHERWETRIDLLLCELMTRLVHQGFLLV